MSHSVACRGRVRFFWLHPVNQPVGRSERHLVAARKSAYELAQSRASFYMPRTDLTEPVAKTWRWTAWKDEPMFAVIATADTIFTGGSNKVYATRAGDGKELWHATVPGHVTDLAFHDNRLFVQCVSGEILCFGPKAVP
jgi:hypothetical protein